MATQHRTDDRSRSATQTGEQGSRAMQQQRQQQGWGGQQLGSARGRQRDPSDMFSPFALGPFSLIRRMTDDVDRLFGGALAGAGTGTGRGEEALMPGLAQSDWSPAIEAFQRDNEFVVRVDVPGMTADDIIVEVGDDALTVSGERRIERQDEREGMLVAERAYGRFTRVIPLPPGAMTDNATANFRDGVLEIVVPAPSDEVRRGRRLDIGQGASASGQAGAAGSAGGTATDVGASAAGREREQQRRG